MEKNGKAQHPAHTELTVHDVNRVLEIGRLLLSVLTPEELEDLQEMMGAAPDNGSQPGTDK